MTYKAIVKGMIQNASEEWVRSLLDEIGFEYDFTSCETAKMEDEKEHISWRCFVDVVSRAHGYTHRFFEVGGTADDLFGILPSCIFDQKHNLIWMANKDTRKTLGIEEFKIA